MADDYGAARAERRAAIEDAYTSVRGRLDYPRRDKAFPYLAAVEALDRLAALAAGSPASEETTGAKVWGPERMRHDPEPPRG